MHRYWRSRILLGALASVICTLAGPTAAQSRDQQAAYCSNDDEDDEGNAVPYPANLVISGCTALIQSGSETPEHRAIAFNNRANAYVGLGDYDHAIEDFDQSIRLDPGKSPTYINRGFVYYNRRDYARAIADYNQAILLNPESADALDLRGLVYEMQGDHDRASADFNQAGRPRSARFLNGRCWDDAIANRDLDRTRAVCDVALRLAPNDPDTLDSRGMVGLKQQRWQDAWNDYDAAARGADNNASALYGRGIAALRLGRRVEGQADLAAAAALDVDISQTYAGHGITP